jgi:hypothetical protein
MSDKRKRLLALVAERDMLEAGLAFDRANHEPAAVLEVTAERIAELEEQIGAAMEADRDA